MLKMRQKDGFDKRYSGRIIELDSLRGIAAVSVLYYHLGPEAGIPTPHVLGQYGVSLFFIISGFVITLTTSRGGPRDFFASRASRLYPTYWCAIFITCVVADFLEKSPPNIRTILINLPMIQSVLRPADVDGTYWTLAVEFQFYVVVGILLWFGVVKKIELFCVTALFLQVISRSFNIGFSPPWAYSLNSDFYLFAVGICIYQVSSGKATKWTMVALFLAPIVSVLGGRVDRLPSEAILAIFVWLASSGKLPALKFRVLVFIGEISYPLYLIHDRVGRDVLRTFNQTGVVPFVLVAFFVGLIATAMHYTVEKPLRSPLRRTLLKLPLTAPIFRKASL